MSVRVLGVDPGTKRVGIALGDTETYVATPLTVIERTRDVERYRRSLVHLVGEWDVSVLVMGLPVTMSGAHGPSAGAATAEAEALRRATGLPVALYDERLTTVTAHRSLQEQGLDSRARRGKVDAVAAAVMLQAWLDGLSAGTVALPGADPTETA